jgi:hypothetical protein
MIEGGTSYDFLKEDEVEEFSNKSGSSIETYHVLAEGMYLPSGDKRPIIQLRSELSADEMSEIMAKWKLKVRYKSIYGENFPKSNRRKWYWFLFIWS